MRLAESRNRRTARETGRGKAGTIGLVVIVGGAAIALWVLLLVLEQMRPQHGTGRESAGADTKEVAR
jgi:hypothetical protein